MNKLALLLSFAFIAPMISGCIFENDLKKSQDNNATLPENETIHDACIIHDESERCWFMVVPAQVTPEYCETESCPLLIDLHAYMEKPVEQSQVSGMAKIAGKDNAITVYPTGHEYDYSWNAGWCCGRASELGIDDVGFILSLIEIIIEEWNVDVDRVYLSGWSNGCTLAQKITSEYSHYIAAMSCMAHYLDDEVHPSYSPVPIMEFHGLIDPWVPYGTQYGHSIIFDSSLNGDEGAIQNLEKWADANKCSGSVPEVMETYEDYSITGYSDCENNAVTLLVTLNFAGHNPYSNEYTGTWEGGPTLYPNPTGIDISLMSWNFLSTFSKS